MTALASIFHDTRLLAALWAAPFIYFTALAVGRWLKRKQGVPLGLMFQIFCVSLAAYVPLRVLHAVEHPQVWHGEGIRTFPSVLIVLGLAAGKK